MATTERINESRACSELWMLLRASGDESPIVDRIGIWGLVAARTTLEPVEAIEKMTEEYRKKPESIYALYRVMPIQRLVQTDLENIKKTSLELGTKIGLNDTYRITVEKRRTRFGSKEIIETVAEGIDRKVNLSKPDWVVLIEITGKLTGISVIKANQILNVQKTKFMLLAKDEKGTSLNDQVG